MCARGYNLEDMFYKERRLMKVEFTKREIELVLNLINDAVSGDFSLGDTQIYSNEELEIINKLELALKRAEKTGLNDGTLPGHRSDSKH